jgi:hypothetical protein
LLLPAQKYLHWRDEPNTRRHEIVSVLNELPIELTIATAHEVQSKRQEHARSLCLADVAREAIRHHVPIRRFAIEGRGRNLDLRDRSTLLDEIRRLNQRPAPAIDFVSKTASPLLWIADAVSSMASTHFSDEPGADHWWRALRPARITLLRTDA